MQTADRYGNPLHAPDPIRVEEYDRALDTLVHFGDDALEHWDATVEAAPDFVMGAVGRAQLRCLSSEAGDAADARSILAALDRDQPMTTREQLHLAATDAYAAGDMHGARETLERVSVDHPRDVLALWVGHQLDFFTGDAVTLRDRIARAMPAWGHDDPMAGFVFGLHAFGLEETGAYAAAEDAGRRALDRNPDDVWAHHAVLHTYEMRGKVATALAFLDERRADWTNGNFLVVHNTWHEALFRLAAGDLAGVLAIYDETLHGSDSEPIAMELLDASSMLWRLHLDGLDVGGRWAPLADAWTTVTSDPWYVFNDVHAVMAYVGAGRLDAARELVSVLRAYASGPVEPGETNHDMTVEVGLPVAEGLLAFAEERYDDAIRHLYPIRRIANRFGGSNAQRDVVARTLLESALRAGDEALANALCRERLARNDTDAYALRQQERSDALRAPSAGAASSEAAKAVRRA